MSNERTTEGRTNPEQGQQELSEKQLEEAAGGGIAEIEFVEVGGGGAEKTAEIDFVEVADTPVVFNKEEDERGRR